PRHGSASAYEQRFPAGPPGERAIACARAAVGHNGSAPPRAPRSATPRPLRAALRRQRQPTCMHGIVVLARSALGKLGTKGRARRGTSQAPQALTLVLRSRVLYTCCA